MFVAKRLQCAHFTRNKTRFNQTGDLLSEYMYQIMQNIVL